MGLAILFFLPTLLVALDLLQGNLEFIALLSPTYAAQTLFSSTLVDINIWMVLGSILYLLVIPAVLYPLLIFKRYEIVAMEG
jgi:hypothetical protein